MRTLLIAVLAAVSCFGQSVPDSVGVVHELAPAPVADTGYFAMVGAGVSRNTMPTAIGWVTFGIKLGMKVCTSDQTPATGCVGSLYSMTTIEMTGQKSQIRTGAALVLAASGNWLLIALIDGGSSTAPAMVGSFSGGGMVAYKWKGFIFTGGLKAVTDGSLVKPTVQIGIGRSF